MGDALLALSVAVSGAVVTLPIPDKIKIYIMAGATFVGGIGKFFTKLFHDEPLNPDV